MSLLSILPPDVIHQWLTGKREALGELGVQADQDIDHAFACERRPEQLFTLLRTTGITYERAFDIACAICGRIVWLLDTDDLPDDVRDDDDRRTQLRQLLLFVAAHRDEFDAFHAYDSFGSDYEDTIIPLTKKTA